MCKELPATGGGKGRGSGSFGKETESNARGSAPQGNDPFPSPFLVNPFAAPSANAEHLPSPDERAEILGTGVTAISGNAHTPHQSHHLLRGGAPKIMQGVDLSSDEEDILLASVHIGATRQQNSSIGNYVYGR